VSTIDKFYISLYDIGKRRELDNVADNNLGMPNSCAIRDCGDRILGTLILLVAKGKGAA